MTLVSSGGGAQRLRRRAQHEGAGAEVDVGGVEIERARGEGHDRLVAIAGDDRNAASVAGERAEATRGAGRLRQHRARDAEEVEQLFGPVALERRPQERARGGRRIREERPLLEQAVQQVARERAGAQARLRGGGADFRQVVEAPAQLARAVMRR